MTPYATMPPDELRESIAVALTWHDPSRWAIGDMLRALRQHGGEDAVQDAMPADDPKAARLAVKCLTVADRWPDEAQRDEWPDLEWSHFFKARWLDGDAAWEWLTQAQRGGWTPAQLGRAMAGLDPDEPAVADMARQLAARGDGSLTLVPQYDGGWAVAGSGAGSQPSIGAAVKAAWRVAGQDAGAALAPETVTGEG